MRYRAVVTPLVEYRRQVGKEHPAYTDATSEAQAGRFLRIRYPYPQYLVENVAPDPREERKPVESSSNPGDEVQRQAEKVIPQEKKPSYSKKKFEPLVFEDNVEVYISEVLPTEVASDTGLHRDPQVEYRYSTYYTGPDLKFFQRDLEKLLRERTGNPNLVLDAYYIPEKPSYLKVAPVAKEITPVTPVESSSNPGEPVNYIQSELARLGTDLEIDLSDNNFKAYRDTIIAMLANMSECKLPDVMDNYVFAQDQARGLIKKFHPGDYLGVVDRFDKLDSAIKQAIVEIAITQCKCDMTP